MTQQNKTETNGKTEYVESCAEIYSPTEELDGWKEKKQLEGSFSTPERQEDTGICQYMYWNFMQDNSKAKKFFLSPFPFFIGMQKP